MCSRAFRPFGLPIYVARVPAAPFSLLPSSLCVDHSHCLVLAPATLAALPSTRAIETRSLPALARFYPCSFTFYVADPSAPFPIWTCSMSLTRDLPIRSVGFPPTNAVHPPASQHGVFIPFAPFGDVMANEAGAIVRCASTLGDRGYKRTLLQQFVMLYVIHV